MARSALTNGASTTFADSNTYMHHQPVDAWKFWFKYDAILTACRTLYTGGTKPFDVFQDSVEGCWTVDLKRRKIRVNVISPGPIDTPIYSSVGMGLSEEQVEQFKKSAVSMVPLGRVGNPDEIAKAVAFLASDDSSYITGIMNFCAFVINILVY
ncbi:MAG: SDR family oxidoreductase [Candidatus Nitrosopolaris sp.]